MEVLSNALRLMLFRPLWSTMAPSAGRVMEYVAAASQVTVNCARALPSMPAGRRTSPVAERAVPSVSDDHGAGVGRREATGSEIGVSGGYRLDDIACHTRWGGGRVWS